jgi:hypothetical protein
MFRPNASRALLSCNSDPGFLWHETCTLYIPSSSDTEICPAKKCQVNTALGICPQYFIFCEKYHVSSSIHDT